MPKYRFIKPYRIRKFVQKKGRQCGNDFLKELDSFISNAVIESCAAIDPPKVRLTRGIIKEALLMARYLKTLEKGDAQDEGKQGL